MTRTARARRSAETGSAWPDRYMLLLLVFPALLLFLSTGVAHAAARFYQGNVTINDAVAINGSEITVTVEGKSGVCAGTFSSGGRYNLVVTDSGGNCPDPGTTPTITFSVNNIAVGAIQFSPADGVQAVDLVVHQAGEALSGKAIVGGAAAVPGTIVSVTVQGSDTPCISTQVGAGGAYEVLVPPATTGTPACPTAGQMLTFALDGLGTLQRVSFEPARSRTLDLISLPAGHNISGTATIGGLPATNASVQAFVGQTACGTATADPLGRFTLTVAAASQQAGCGASDTTIAFTVGGQRASQSITFQNGGNTTGYNLSAASLTCVYADQTPPDRVAVEDFRPTISVNVACATPPGLVNMTIDTTQVAPVVSGNGNTRSVSFKPTAPLSPGVHIVTVGVAAANQATWTFIVGQATAVGEWFDRPPASQGGVRACPPRGEWRLLYWNGPSDASISSAALFCSDAEVFWLNRDRRWLGYAKGAATVSDLWNSVQGDAVFIRGK